MNPITYLQDTIAELKQVRWPSKDTTIRLTVLVIGISIIVAVYIGALDFGFTNLLTVMFK